MKHLSKGLALGAALSLTAGSALADGPHLNEIYASHSGTDDQEFIELIGTPNASLSGIVVMIVEGDSTNPGTLDDLWDLSSFTMPADGYFVLGTTAVANVDLDIGTDNIIENGTETFYVVHTTNVNALSALVGTNVDMDGDLITDIAALSDIIDIIAMVDTGLGSGDLVYDGTGWVGPDNTFFPAGIYRSLDFPNAWCSQTFLDFTPGGVNEPQTPGTANGICLETTTYCVSGTSASGCQAKIWSSGIASSTATSGFHLYAGCVEGAKDGLFFYGVNGQQAQPWGNGTSFQCVTPPVKRGGLLTSTGTAGQCDGVFRQDLNARWCATCPKPLHNPGMGAVVQAQLWYRDPMNTSNQTTSLSNAVEFTVQ